MRRWSGGARRVSCRKDFRTALPEPGRARLPQGAPDTTEIGPQRPGPQQVHIAPDAAVHHDGQAALTGRLRYFQLNRAGTRGKGCDTFGPTGPWLMTPDEIADVDAPDMWLDLDGTRMQYGSTATLIFNIPHLIA